MSDVEAPSLALPDRAWGEPEQPARAAGVPLNRLLDIGRRVIGALLMAEGVRDIACSVDGNHMNMFWFPLMHSSFLPGMLFLAIGVGIWRADAWARLLCGTLSLLSWILLGIVEPVLVAIHPVVGQGPEAIPYFLLFSVPSGALAFYCFMPTIRKHFAQVREARDRLTLR